MVGVGSLNSKVALATRILLGLIFLVFGTNGLLTIFAGRGFIPIPPPNAAMAPVMQGFFGAVYLMPLVKVIQVVAGVMLLTGRYVPLAITLLAPIVVNILGVHVFLDRGGLPMAMVITILMSILFMDRWDAFKPLLRSGR